MQHVILGRNSPDDLWFLALVCEAYDYFEATENAALIRELVRRAKRWDRQLDELIAKDAPEAHFRKIWSEVDKFDAKFDRLGSPLDAHMLDDIRQHPDKYISTVSQVPSN